MSAEAVIHLVDDDEAIRESLSFLLDTAGFEVKTYESGESFMAALPGVESGCIVTDIRMPGMSGLDLVQAIKAAGRTVPIVVITGHGDVPLAVEAMKAGVADFIEKPFGDEGFLKAIRSALSQGADRARREGERSAAQERIEKLSTRERQVLDGLVAGQPNKIIAYELGISARTVEIYRANVMSKMQAASLSELVRMALAAQV